ncbi:hypothetical protein MKX03_026393 [Papaver bracteatum]|nr:hypothetical protein MKX03_026393 [Papaver bracteatum]
MIHPNESSSSSGTTPATSPTDRNLFEKQKSSSSSSSGNKKKRNQFGEVVGGTAAECAAVCCCCPCGLMNILVLLIYRLPAEALKKALRIRKKTKRNKRIKKLKRSSSCLSSYYGGADCYEDELEKQKKELNSVNKESSSSFEEDEDAYMFRNRLSKEVMELDEEMLDRFRGAGFWRSPSQVSQRYCVTECSLS